MQELRLLPLLSSGTEIVHALGLGKYQVGRSHECDFPPAVAALPICTRPAISVSGSSAEIDRLVKERVASAVSVYDVDSALIRQLRPTHVITQTQCKVCAVSLDDVEKAFAAETGSEAHIVSLEPYALRDVWQDILRVADACNARKRGEELIGALKRRMECIQDRVPPGTSKPRVAAIEWLEPLMAGGNWVPELISMAGGQNLFGKPGEHSPWMTWEEVVEADPDVIVALPCGFDLPRTRAEMYWISERPDWTDLRAVQTGNVFLCDGNQFMNRPGPRLVESLQTFAEIFYPEVFGHSLQGSAWERF